MKAASITNTLAGFFSWWLDELKACLPKPVREFLFKTPGVLAVRVVGRNLVMAHLNDSSSEEFARIPLLEDPRSLPRRIAREASRARRRGLAFALALDPTKVLRRTVTLPLAACENLREVIGFELDRYTPFRTDEVEYDYEILRRDVGRKKVIVDLAVVPKREIEPVTALMNLLGLRPKRIGIAGDREADLLRFSFLPTIQETGHGIVWRTVTATAAVVIIALFGIAVYLPWQEKNIQVLRLEAALVRAQTEAATSKLLSDRTALLEGHNDHVLREKLDTPTNTEIVDRVTHLMPDDTWLQQMSWKDHGLELAGFSAKPARLIEILEQSEYLSRVRFTSPVTPYAQLDAERFKIRADVNIQGTAK